MLPFSVPTQSFTQSLTQREDWLLCIAWMINANELFGVMFLCNRALPVTGEISFFSSHRAISLRCASHTVRYERTWTCRSQETCHSCQAIANLMNGMSCTVRYSSQVARAIQCASCTVRYSSHVATVIQCMSCTVRCSSHVATRINCVTTL